MNNSTTWSILEKLADPASTQDERIRLLQEIESDPALLAQWKAFSVLQEWPELENVAHSTEGVLDRIQAVQKAESFDAGIKQAFPYVAAAALAASVLLAFINIGQTEDSSDITLDDVFGLPQPTIENTLLVNL